MEEKNTSKKAYTFSDVLIVPKYSEIESRRNVDISSDFGKFKIELPIFSANMKSITEEKMAIAMAENAGIGILHRFCSIEEAVRMFSAVKNHFENPVPNGESYSVGNSNACFQVDNQIVQTSSSCSMSSTVKPICKRDFNVGVSIGVQEDDKDRYTKLYEAGARIFVIDIANGFCKLMKDMVCWIKSQNLKDVYIIGGNIATAEGAYEMAEWGVDCVKVGIGPGCFTPDMLVKTNKGLKKISEIKNGDFVYTHKGRLSEVINTIKYKIKEKIIKINNISCTRKHLFYVIDKKDRAVVNENNIEMYAKWISAKDLNNHYLLVKIKD